MTLRRVSDKITCLVLTVKSCGSSHRQNYCEYLSHSFHFLLSLTHKIIDVDSDTARSRY